MRHDVIKGSEKVEILAQIEDIQVVDGFFFKGCKELASDILEAGDHELLTARGLLFDTQANILVLGNKNSSSRGASYECPGGKVSDKLCELGTFEQAGLEEQVKLVLNAFLREVHEESKLFLIEGSFRYEGPMEDSFVGDPYYLEDDKELKSKPFSGRVTLWFSGALPPLAKECVQVGTKMDANGKQEDEHDEAVLMAAKDYVWDKSLLAKNSQLPGNVVSRLLKISQTAISDQVSRVISGADKGKTKLDITTGEHLSAQNVVEIIKSNRYFFDSETRKLDRKKVHEIAPKAIACVRNAWGIDIPEEVTRAFYRIHSVRDVINFVAAKDFTGSEKAKERKAIQLILDALEIYGVLAEKGYLRDDLEDEARKFRAQYLKEFKFKPVKKNKKEELSPLWEDYDKYIFIDQSGNKHNVFVKKNAKAEERVVNKYLTKPTLSLESDIKDLLGLRFVFEDSKAVQAFNAWLSKNKVLEKLNITQDTEEGSNVEGSNRAQSGEIKYIGSRSGLPCELQALPQALHQSDESGVKHHKNYVVKQSSQGGLRVDNHELYTHNYVNTQIRMLAKELKIKPDDLWHDWRRSYFKGPGEVWYSFEAVCRTMNTPAIRDNQEEVIRSFLSALNSQCSISEMDTADWYHLFNAPEDFCSNPSNLYRIEKIHPRLSNLRSNVIIKSVVPALETALEKIQ